MFWLQAGTAGWLKLSSACTPHPFPSYMMAFHSKTLAVVQATCCKQIKNKKKGGGKIVWTIEFCKSRSSPVFQEFRI